MNELTYRYGNDLDLDRVVELYHASTLGERRPVDDREIMADMIRHANLVVGHGVGWRIARRHRPDIDGFCLRRLSRRLGGARRLSKARHRH